MDYLARFTNNKDIWCFKGREPRKGRQGIFKIYGCTVISKTESLSFPQNLEQFI